ncbi:hypothetical protein F1188_11000 [Roseospira marina]|uniref:Uncharacterized protein n=1 Tax=Roseospira marina TaxID=140057 RepID=A0A5M6IBC4_9PROT|nr:hypothetical protein [Roseospira marina]KAA5605422.1 hypothetical protein F1188_11000 [Roseospira marina]MBB4314584.1 hypothetical protein [Roseospira marina]MBB5088854.1 hypothetical protein [Roseospira marina]
MPGLSSIRSVANAMDRAGPPGTDLVHLNTEEMAALVRAGFPARRAADGTLAFPDAPADAVARAGVRGDTEVAHAGKQARRALKAAGGEGSRNPTTGKRQYAKGGNSGSDSSGSDSDRGGNDGQSGKDRGSGRTGSSDNSRDSIGSDAATGGKGGRGERGTGGGSSNGRTLTSRMADVGVDATAGGRYGIDDISRDIMSQAMDYDDIGNTVMEDVGNAALSLTTGVREMAPSLERAQANLETGQTGAHWGVDPVAAAVGIGSFALGGPPGLGALTELAFGDMVPDVDLGPDVFGGQGTPNATTDATAPMASTGTPSYADSRDGQDAPVAPDEGGAEDEDPAEKTVEERAYFLPSYVRPDSMQESDAMAWNTGGPPGRGLSSIVSAQGRYGDTETAHLSPAAQDALRWLGGSGSRNPTTGKREFFDADYYLSQNPDVAESGMNPLTHYQTYGYAEGRAGQATPSGFNAKRYLEGNPDVAEAGVDAYSHWVDHGRGEGRPIHAPTGDGPGTMTGPQFEKDYLAANPDVAEAVKAGQFKSGAEHHLLHGLDENRPTSVPTKPEDPAPEDPAPDFETILNNAISGIQDYYTSYIDDLLGSGANGGGNGNSSGSGNGSGDDGGGSSGTGGDLSSGPLFQTPRYRTGRYRGTSALGF